MKMDFSYLEKGLFSYRKGYSRSEKKARGTGKGHGATRKWHGAGPF